MYLNKKLIFLSTIITLNVVCCQRRGLRQLQCNKNSYKEVDRMIAKSSPYGNPDVKFPETLEELQNRCEYLYFFYIYQFFGKF